MMPTNPRFINMADKQLDEESCVSGGCGMEWSFMWVWQVCVFLGGCDM